MHAGARITATHPYQLFEGSQNGGENHPQLL